MVRRLLREAFFFTLFPDTIQKTGVDISKTQIKKAKKNNPKAKFHCQNVLNMRFPKESFDLVTSFWGGYLYLGNIKAIKRHFKQLIKITKPEGSIYLDIIPMNQYDSLHRGEKIITLSWIPGKVTGQIEFPNEEDPNQWNYYDEGGKHEMYSPEISFIEEIFSA